MATKRLSIVAALQRTIRESGLTHYRLAKDAGLSPEIIDRFMADDDKHRDVRLETAEKLAKVLDLELRKRG
jgi:transcriptional regulator with XRE-family HTH domain